LVDCKKCKSRERADKLIEEEISSKKMTLDDIQKIVSVQNTTPEAWTFEQQTAFLN
jgi:glycyl-tRNA synthetase (class II)